MAQRRSPPRPTEALSTLSPDHEEPLSTLPGNQHQQFSSPTIIAAPTTTMNASEGGKSSRPKSGDPSYASYWLPDPNDRHESARSQPKRRSMTSRMKIKRPSATPDHGRKALASSPPTVPRGDLDKPFPSSSKPSQVPSSNLPAPAPEVPISSHSGTTSSTKALHENDASTELESGTNALLGHNSTIVSNNEDFDHYSETVDVETQYAKPVVHETIEPHVHHVVTNSITRDIHNHHIVHRVQPISDVVVLPTKHYAPLGPKGALVEISDPGPIPAGVSGAPPKTRERTWKTAYRLPEQAATTVNPSSGSAKATKQEERDWVGDDGVHKKETTWFHPAMANYPGEPAREKATESAVSAVQPASRKTLRQEDSGRSRTDAALHEREAEANASRMASSDQIMTRVEGKEDVEADLGPRIAKLSVRQ
ncbi:hypothetical protein FH972_022487 [Carpinus fangiana]|uniref:Uncharacterized protein n=1 Tax=Carpinus fangiana TaxID=176857 RepID=A0A5N6KSQ5_9ROSI|nr:hypothetical protein FH972_022487 [Carpinus fangiana]